MLSNSSTGKRMQVLLAAQPPSRALKAGSVPTSGCSYSAYISYRPELE